MIIEMGDDIFAKNLVALRNKYAMSQCTLARLIGISESLLAGIEDGTEPPAIPLESFRRIYRIFDIESNDLIRIDLSRFL